MAMAQREKDPEVYEGLSRAYDQMVLAVERQELGWGMYICQK